MKKNIWIVNQYAIPPKFGGLNRHYYFAKFLEQKGYNVRIFTSSKIHNSNVNIIEDSSLSKNIDFDEIKYTFLRSSNYKNNGIMRVKNMILFAHFVKNFLFKHKSDFEDPDIIYTSSPSPFVASAAIGLAKKLGIPVITEIRDLWPESIVCYKGISRKNLAIKVLYALEKSIYKNSDKLIFTMPGFHDYFKELRLKVDDKKAYNINNGVDLDEFYKNANVSFEDEDLLCENTFKVIYTGSIREVNNLCLLIDTAKKMQKTHKDIIFLIYGEGNEKENLTKRCIKENITNVKFKGHVPREKIPFILSKSNINIIIVRQTPITRFGTSLNKMYDYMASGKPIVSNLKSNYDFLEIYGCGITSDSSEPYYIEKAIEKIYNLSRKDYAIMCENAKNAAKDFDYKKLSEKLINVVESL